MSVITPEQCRAARALLKWSREDLAEHSSVTERTIADFESEARSPRRGTLEQLALAFALEHVGLIPENGGGAGVRFIKPNTEASKVYIRAGKVTRIDRRGMRTHAPAGVYILTPTGMDVTFSSPTLGESFTLMPMELAQYGQDRAFILLDGTIWPIG